MAQNAGYAPEGHRTASTDDRYDLEAVKRAINLCDVIHLERERDFGGYKSGCCPHPAHEDANPSFLVWPHWFECKSTGAHEPPFKGSIIDWFIFDRSPVWDGWGDLLRQIVEAYSLVGVKSLADFTSLSPKLPKPKAAPWVEKLPSARVDKKSIPVIDSVERDFFQWRYQLSSRVIDREQFGYDTRRRAFVIPIWDGRHREILSVRYRRFDLAFESEGNFDYKLGDWYVPRYWGMKGSNYTLLYNRYRLMSPRSDVIRILLGEISALFVDRTLKLDAVSVTNGKGAFKPYFARMIKQVYNRVIIVPDHGEVAEAVRIAAMFGPIAEVVMPMDVPGDVIDWIREGHLNKADYLEWESSSLVPCDGIKRSGLGDKLWMW